MELQLSKASSPDSKEPTPLPIRPTPPPIDDKVNSHQTPAIAGHMATPYHKIKQAKATLVQNKDIKGKPILEQQNQENMEVPQCIDDASANTGLRKYKVVERIVKQLVVKGLDAGALWIGKTPHRNQSKQICYMLAKSWHHGNGLNVS
jgi:hypothetical protein